MTLLGQAFAESARSFLGTRFKLGGFKPEFGIDCVGLVYCSLIRIGRAAERPTGYRIRNSSFDRHTTFACKNGFTACCGDIGIGDLIMVSPGPGQRHLMIADAPPNFIHAHAGIGRVVCTPALHSWPICGHWRLSR